jgi:integrase
MIKQNSAGNYAVRIDHVLVRKNKDYKRHFTRPTLDDAVQFETNILAHLDRGYIPHELIREGKPSRKVIRGWTLSQCFEAYRNEAHPAHSDLKLLETIERKDGVTSTHDLTAEWTHKWIEEMKRVDNLAPGTIKHRRGALSRCIDWMIKRHSEVMAANPLSVERLDKDYAQYTREDVKRVAARGGKRKTDQERDRRLEEGEEQSILKAICDGFTDTERVFFLLALESAMRMREMYTLDAKQFFWKKSTIHLERTKNGSERDVPMTNSVVRMLEIYVKENKKAIQERAGRLFPYWNGALNEHGEPDENELIKTTSRVSRLFADTFAAAECIDLKFHDTRHEATCRLFLYTTLDSFQIAKITGHKDPRMLLRYLSLRGSDLVKYLPDSLSDANKAGVLGAS